MDCRAGAVAACCAPVLVRARRFVRTAASVAGDSHTPIIRRFIALGHLPLRVYHTQCAYWPPQWGKGTPTSTHTRLAYGALVGSTHRLLDDRTDPSVNFAAAASSTYRPLENWIGPLTELCFRGCLARIQSSWSYAPRSPQSPALQPSAHPPLPSRCNADASEVTARGAHGRASRGGAWCNAGPQFQRPTGHATTHRVVRHSHTDPLAPTAGPAAVGPMDTHGLGSRGGEDAFAEPDDWDDQKKTSFKLEII